MRLVIWTGILLVGFGSQAATPFKKSLSEKKNAYVTTGTFIGGQANPGGISLLNVRRSFSAKAKVERVMIDLGDKEMKPLSGNLSYYQASIDPGQNRVVLDLAQFKMSRVSEQQVRNLFRKSPYVKSADLTLDPEDKAATLVLHLKQPMRLEVFKQNSKKVGRIVMDLTPITGSAKTRKM